MADDFYITRSGDTFDIAAARAYGSAMHAGWLMRNNTAHLSTWRFNEGVELYAPPLPAEAAEAAILPPWRRARERAQEERVRVVYVDRDRPIVPVLITEPSSGAIVFREALRVEGTAAANSRVEVNGVATRADAQGEWAITLTLSAGREHVITATGAEGQSARVSVYVWGKPDLLALQPLVWLDPSDVATLFVDDAMTIPAVDGDPIGGWRNKGTLGSDGDAAQPVSANRPVWTDAGGGKFEALGMQRLATQVQNLNYPVECWAVVEPLASVRSTYLSNRIVGSATSGVNAGISQNSLHHVAIRDAGPPVINSAYTSTPSSSVHGPRVVWLRIDREQITVGQYIEAGERTFDFGRQLLAQLGGPPLEVGARGADEQIRIGNIILFDRMLTTNERIKIQAYLEAQHD